MAGKSDRGSSRGVFHPARERNFCPFELYTEPFARVTRADTYRVRSGCSFDLRNREGFLIRRFIPGNERRCGCVPICVRISPDLLPGSRLTRGSIATTSPFRWIPLRTEKNRKESRESLSEHRDSTETVEKLAFSAEERENREETASTKEESQNYRAEVEGSRFD